MNTQVGKDNIEYTDEDGKRGILYNWHCDSWTREWHYTMSIYDRDGFEILHAYNAAPKTVEELKDAMKHVGSYFIREMAKKCE
jgi:hypothetical protein